MWDKNIFPYICFGFIATNVFVFYVYYQSGASTEFMERSNLSVFNQLHTGKVFPYAAGMKYHNFAKVGQDIVPVWSAAVQEEHVSSRNEFPSRYLKFIKNPCWLEVIPKKTDTWDFNITEVIKYDVRGKKRQTFLKTPSLNETYRMRCLPYFLIIGQPKCGTTDLYFRLTQHHQVIPSLMKGPHWWTRTSFGNGDKKPVPLSSYIDLFSSAADVIARRIQENNYNIQEQVVTGEASPSTLWDTTGAFAECRKTIQRNGRDENLDPETNKTCSGLKGSSWIRRVPKRIKSLLPNVSLIAILRNPTERLYSDFLYFDRSSNKSKKLFHQKVKNAIHVFQTCVRNSSATWCTYATELRHRMEVRLYIGLYVIYLRNWMKVFKPSQFHIIRFEDYVSRPRHVLNQVFRFLKLSDLSIREEETIWSTKPLNRNPLFKTHGPMLRHTRRLLDEFYAPFNRELSVLLQDSRFLWEGLSPSKWNGREFVKIHLNFTDL